MKFDSTLVNVEGKDIVIVAVDTHFFSLPQEEKGELVHHVYHLDALAHDHVGQILRRSYHIHAVYRQILQNGELCVAGSWRQIHHQIIQLAPDYLFPKLLDDAGNDRTVKQKRLQSRHSGRRYHRSQHPQTFRPARQS